MANIETNFSEGFDIEFGIGSSSNPCAILVMNGKGRGGDSLAIDFNSVDQAEEFVDQLVVARMKAKADYEAKAKKRREAAK